MAFITLEIMLIISDTSQGTSVKQIHKRDTGRSPYSLLYGIRNYRTIVVLEFMTHKSDSQKSL